MNKPSQLRLSPYLVLLVGIFAISTSSVFIRLAQREASSVVVAAYRLGIAALVLLPFAWGRRDEIRAMSRKQWVLVGLSGVFLAVHFVSWVTSLSLTSVASSVVLVTTTPLWVALLSPVFLREKLTPLVWVGLVVALTGGTLVGLSEACQLTAGGVACPDLGGFFQGKAFLGNLLALVGAWMAAAYMMVGRKVRAALSVTAYISVVYSVAAILLWGLALASRQPVVGFSPPIYVWFALLALVPQLIGHSSFNYALGYLPAAYVSVATLAEPIGTTLLAIAVLNELPSVPEIVGGVIILAGIAIASLNTGSGKVEM
ncbi:MAG: DMT family transporter [Anaerolineaceae bacterium]|nr:DMT family transporter [Anaerolineaceae bacterium]